MLLKAALTKADEFLCVWGQGTTSSNHLPRAISAMHETEQLLCQIPVPTALESSPTSVNFSSGEKHAPLLVVQISGWIWGFEQLFLVILKGKLSPKLQTGQGDAAPGYMSK